MMSKFWQTFFLNVEIIKNGLHINKKNYMHIYYKHIYIQIQKRKTIKKIIYEWLERDYTYT